LGATTPPIADGKLTAGTAGLNVPVVVEINGAQATVSYSGPAPQEVAGPYQVNVVGPSATPVGARIPVEVYAGQYASQPGLTVSVGQPPH
jgi:uncharacterized protein (TIGR03437 family)